MEENAASMYKHIRYTMIEHLWKECWAVVVGGGGARAGHHVGHPHQLCAGGAGAGAA